MIINGVRADEQFLRNLIVLEPLGEEENHFEFTTAETKFLRPFDYGLHPPIGLQVEQDEWLAAIAYQAHTY